MQHYKYHESQKGEGEKHTTYVVDLSAGVLAAEVNQLTNYLLEGARLLEFHQLTTLVPQLLSIKHARVVNFLGVNFVEVMVQLVWVMIRDPLRVLRHCGLDCIHILISFKITLRIIVIVNFRTLPLVVCLEPLELRRQALVLQFNDFYWHQAQLQRPVVVLLRALQVIVVAGTVRYSDLDFLGHKHRKRQGLDSIVDGARGRLRILHFIYVFCYII